MISSYLGSEHLGGFKLLRAPMKEGQCAECAVVHRPEMPHNQQSLFWQYNFREKHGRWPTWADALAHCTPEMRAQWVKLLAEHGVIVKTIPTLVNAEAVPVKSPLDKIHNERTQSP